MDDHGNHAGPSDPVKRRSLTRPDYARPAVTPPLVLAYHAVSEKWDHSLAVRERDLARHVAVLSERGYKAFTFAEAETRRRASTLPRRSLVITFDDGFASVLRALPILSELGWPATVFVVTDFAESGEALRWRGMETSPPEGLPLGWEELGHLVEAGWEIGSHTVGHRLLTELDDERLGTELSVSKRAIEERIGSCETLAYPYGLADARVAAHVERAGYLAACTSTHSHRVDEPFRRPRVGISRGDRGLRLALKLSPTYLRVRRTRIGDLVDRARLARRSSRERLLGEAT
jgi:peptidoglycan/xylan/chitin deacetylase (PgdA/CDA1 family)